MLLPVQLITTFVGGVLIALTFGIFALMVTILWLPVLAVLLGTSWLWLNAPPLRVLLFLPGIAIAMLAHAYVALMPEIERDAKYYKLSLAGEWPLSWWLTPTADVPMSDNLPDAA